MLSGCSDRVRKTISPAHLCLQDNQAQCPRRLLFSRVVDTLAQPITASPQRLASPIRSQWLFGRTSPISLATRGVRKPSRSCDRKSACVRATSARRATKTCSRSPARGLFPQNSLEKLRDAAEIAKESFADDLGSVLHQAGRRPPKKTCASSRRLANRLQKKSSSSITNCRRSHLDSNGLRVLVRLGFAPEKKSYAATYKGVREALAPQLPTDCKVLVRAHQLLRQHGQELCKRSKPICARCPLRAECPFFAETDGIHGEVTMMRSARRCDMIVGLRGRPCSDTRVTLPLSAIQKIRSFDSAS